MRKPPHFKPIHLLPLLLCTFAFGQDHGAAAKSAVSASVPHYSRRAPVPITTEPVQLTISSSTVLDAKTGKPIGASKALARAAARSEDVHNPGAGNIDGLVTVPTFDGAFAAEGGPSQGNLFRFSMIGNDPRLGDTTRLPAKISEVSLQLLNADGSVFQNVPFDPFSGLMLDSPNFRRTNYGDGAQLQYADAIQRAEFWNRMRRDWHTELSPSIVNQVTITVPYTVQVELGDGSIVTARSYFTGTAADGSTFVLMLSPLFNFFFDNEVVNEINLNNFTQDAVNETWWPNTFLFDLNTSNPNTPGGCCVLGFHTYFLDGAVPQDRWITIFSSWISPGLFGSGFQDVTGLSHETSEAFNDPFVDNATPNWQFPGEPANSKVCQNNLETGDPIEVLPTATIPIAIHEHGGKYIYHPQVEALLPWFEMGTSSNAIDGAFSYPNETVLLHSAVPCPQ